MPDVDVEEDPTQDEPAGGFGFSFTNLVETGMPNGGFNNGAPDPSLDITFLGANDMPDIYPVFTSGTVPIRRIADATSPSGWAMRGTINAGGGAGDAALVSWYHDIGGNRRGGFPDKVQCQFVAPAGNTGTFSVDLKLLYYDINLSSAGMPAEVVVTATIAPGATVSLEAVAGAGGIKPTNARILRVQCHFRRGAAGTGTTGSIRLMPVSRSAKTSVQEFTASGTAYLPADAQFVQVTLIAGGGGGGSGRRGAAGSVRPAGGGGGGGGCSVQTFLRSALSDTVAVTIGPGGAGGTAPAADSTNGNVGTNGTNSYFGPYLYAGYGSGGAGGAGAVASAGGVGGPGIFNGPSGGQGGVGGATTDSAGRGTAYTAGGGGGGGLTAANVPEDGGPGGVPFGLLTLVAAAAGGTPGNSGSNGLPPPTPVITGGTGSGGGGSNGSGTNTAGARGAGGGGGGGRLNGGQGKAGGAGGDGYCVVVCW